MARDLSQRPQQAPEGAAAARGERAGKATSEIFSLRLGLRLTPQGHLLCEAADDAPDMDEAAAARLGEAFARGSGQGLLRLGAGEVGQALPPIFVWWRGFATRYVGGAVPARSRHGNGGSASAVVPEVPPPRKANSPRWC